MSFTKTAVLASACLLVSVAIASADEVRLADEALDTVTAGAINPIPSITPIQTDIGGLDGSPTLFGPLNPPPPPEPPAPPPTSGPPSFPGGGGLSNLQQLLQQLFAFANQS